MSFDFDSTLTLVIVQQLASTLIYIGHDIHIVTNRFEKYDHSGNAVTNREVFEIAEELGIPRENIHFCEMAQHGKAEFFLNNPGFLWHLDDDDIDLEEIRTLTNVYPIWRSYRNDWTHQCYDILRITEFDQTTIIKQNI